MKELEKLMECRESIKVLDATLRDGGLVNDFYFTDEFVQALVTANVKAGVDYMEIGYKADKEQFDVNKFGKWKFCNEDDVWNVIGDRKCDMKLSVMADVGRCDYKNDIVNRADSNIYLVRVATYINTMPQAIAMIEDAAKKGYETTCNIMALSTAQESDVKIALEMLGKSPVNTFYIVDSYGSLYPEQVSRISGLFLEVAEKYGKKVGMHAHNNQQLAFANTIEACGCGVDWLDATCSGMGRGAGNCYLESIIGFLHNPKYNIFPLVKFIDQYMNPLKASGVTWGYDSQYLFTGLLNQHPRTAIEYTKKNRTDLTEFYKEIVIQD